MSKKNWSAIAIFCAFVMLAISGCDNKNPQYAQKYVDKTVFVESFDPSEFSADIMETSSFSFATLYKNKEELYKVSKNVVYGTVKDISYFDESGAAMILYDFAIEEVYKGSLNKNDLISILTNGGYVRASKYVELYGRERFSNYTDEKINNTVIMSDNMGMPIPKVGDKYLLFLSAPIDDEPPFPNGAYVEKGGFMGRYVEANNHFIRYKPADEPDFYMGGEEKISKTEAKTYLKNAKEQTTIVK